MDYRDLRFMGFYVHEDSGYERARAKIMDELRAREADALSPGGYQPDDAFKKAVSDFETAYRAFGESLLARARMGEDISTQSITTLERAEMLYAIASPATLKKAFENIALLDKGKNISGTGSSLTHLLKRELGLDAQEDARERRLSTIEFRPLSG